MKDCASDRGNWMQLTLPARPSNLGLARVAVASFAAGGGFTLPDIEELKVAVSEAVSNVVLHAYPDGEGEVQVCAQLRESELTVEVVDSGVGMEDVSRATEASYSTLEERMGVGFAFIEAFMDDVVVESTPAEGTRIVMRKRLTADQDETSADTPSL